MSVVCFKRVGSWLLEKLTDGIVYLLDLLLRFLCLMGWSPRIKVKKDKHV